MHLWLPGDPAHRSNERLGTRMSHFLILDMVPSAPVPQTRSALLLHISRSRGRAGGPVGLPDGVRPAQRKPVPGAVLQLPGPGVPPGCRRLPAVRRPPVPHAPQVCVPPCTLHPGHLLLKLLMGCSQAAGMGGREGWCSNTLCRPWAAWVAGVECSPASPSESRLWLGHSAAQPWCRSSRKAPQQCMGRADACAPPPLGCGTQRAQPARSSTEPGPGGEQVPHRVSGQAQEAARSGPGHRHLRHLLHPARRRRGPGRF